MSKILSYLGRYVCTHDPQKTIEVFRGFESTTVSFSDLGDTQFERILKKPEEDIFDENVWVKCADGNEIDFRKNGLLLKNINGELIEYKKK
jgi:hypothetical protein